MKIITIIIFITIINFIISPTFAADSTPSADIRAKLEELKKEIASRAAKLKQEINNKLRDKAYIGSVKSESDTALTLVTSAGPRMVSLNQDTVFDSIVKSKQKFSQKTLAEKDYLAALGDVDDTNVLTAKKVILLPSPALPLKTYFWGQVTAISDKLITLKDKKGQSVAANLSNSSALKVNDFVILTGRMGKNDIFAAEFVYTIPKGGILKPKRSATPSAKIAAPAEKVIKPTSR